MSTVAAGATGIRVMPGGSDASTAAATAAAALAVSAMAAGQLPKLPPEEFTYIGRPSESFEGRWAAIERVLATCFGNRGFSLLDVGSNHGYFALNTSLRFPQSQVIGIEGSVGIGNGSLGTSTRDAQRLCVTGAVRKHLEWIKILGLKNNFVAPEVWDLDYCQKLCKAGLRADAMLTLSVVHHIDGICQNAYASRGLGPVEGSLELIATIMLLADVHILELPDSPWLGHLHNEFKSAGGIIKAALQRTGEEWECREIYRNEWIGSRELWLIERKASRGMLPRGDDLRSFFPVVIPGHVLDMDAVLQAPVATDNRSSCDSDETVEIRSTVTITGDASFAKEFVLGTWKNAYGVAIQALPGGNPQQITLRYTSARDGEELHTMQWQSRDGCWTLCNKAGSFALVAVSPERLTWRERQKQWVTKWTRAQLT
eukprot:gnl/TRDRNA2_/TRDRNA2_44913_c0_seq2.p1 gnl/TRDRNA2_/TRDRNA2_44913_c0~~gnl/TRDRNA2_/TRDRNA2_44913_c0_seq2.p1  ORF type:complete len:428 (+),score=61.16 gnl/TRDRNA2_/TRDRNA2_44913_c0_seq2:42-1325(+)